MQLRRITGIMLAGTLACTTYAFAQDGAKQDMKDAGHETAAAAKDAGHGVKKGTKKGYHATKHATKHAAHETKEGAEKTATGTRNVGRRAEGKEPVPNNPQ
ncbi:MAG: hypothetical protein M3R43_05800 [Acidobacteriota bacterium]|nr:hypothetical protein [Acidobacteriota bacterium]